MGFSSWAYYRTALLVKDTSIWVHQTDLIVWILAQIASYANLDSNISHFWHQTQKSSDTIEVNKHHTCQSLIPKLGKLLALFAAVSEFVIKKALGSAVIALRCCWDSIALQVVIAMEKSRIKCWRIKHDLKSTWPLFWSHVLQHALGRHCQTQCLGFPDCKMGIMTPLPLCRARGEYPVTSDILYC